MSVTESLTFNHLNFVINSLHFFISCTVVEIVLGEQGTAGQVVNALHQAGGLVVLAHPARYRQPASRLISQAAQLGIDGVEAYYAYGNPKPWVSSPPQMEEVLYLSQVYNLASTCGTDSHGESILFRV